LKTKRDESPATAALILTSDTLIGALIGAAIDLAGVRPAFPADGESPRDALRRIRPGIVLIDGADALANNEAVLGPALMTRARVFIIATAKRAEQLASLASRYDLSFVIVPRDLDRLATIVQAAPPSASRSSTRQP
jgi:hypothetical protein